MTDVPDIVHCTTTSNSKITVMSAGETSAQAFVNGDTLSMDAEDSLPAIATPSAVVEGTTSIAPSDAAAEVEYVFDDNAPLLERIERLKQQELLFLRKSGSGFYAMLIAYYFASFDWQQVRLCRMRIEALFNRKDKQLTTFANIARNLEQRKFGAALRLCKETDFMANSLRKLMLEVQERLFLYILLLVQNSYISLEASRLAEMLDVSPVNLPEVIRRFGWTISNNGFVYPIMSQEFAAVLEERKKSPFGVISLTALSETQKSCSRSSDEELESLANFVASMET